MAKDVVPTQRNSSGWSNCIIEGKEEEHCDDYPVEHVLGQNEGKVVETPGCFPDARTVCHGGGKLCSTYCTSSFILGREPSKGGICPKKVELVRMEIDTSRDLAHAVRLVGNLIYFSACKVITK